MPEIAPPIPPHLTLAGRAETLAPALMLLLAGAIVATVGALGVAIWPFNVNELAWRVQSAVLFLSTLAPLLIMFAVIALAAVATGQHRVVRIVAICFCSLAGMIALILPLFALDFLAARHFQRVSSLPVFTGNGLRLLATGAVLFPCVAWAGRKAWLAGQPAPSASLVPELGLVVGQPVYDERAFNSPVPGARLTGN